MTNPEKNSQPLSSSPCPGKDFTSLILFRNTYLFPASLPASVVVTPRFYVIFFSHPISFCVIFHFSFQNYLSIHPCLFIRPKCVNFYIFTFLSSQSLLHLVLLSRTCWFCALSKMFFVSPDSIYFPTNSPWYCFAFSLSRPHVAVEKIHAIKILRFAPSTMFWFYLVC